MSNDIFAKFNEMFNSDELAKDIAETVANSKPFEKKEIPYGNYEVKIVKLEIGEHDFDGDYKGMPEAKVCFQIINHEELAGQRLYMNKKLISLKKPQSGFMLHKFVEFLNSLETSYTVTFENWEQFGDLVASMFNEIDGRAEYNLSFFENNGFKDYAIVERFL
jgi:hypothetical protein